MRTNDEGVALIKEFEGRRLHAYRDTGGVLTIGYGHTSAAGSPHVTPGMTISEAEAERILRKDLAVFERAVLAAVKVPLTESQFAALVSFTFNLGDGNLRASTLLRKLNAGDYTGAAAEFPRWNKAAGIALAGLKRRRAAEQRLFMKNTAPKPKPQPSTPPVHKSPAPSGLIAFIAAIGVAAVYFLTKG